MLYVIGGCLESVVFEICFNLSAACVYVTMCANACMAMTKCDNMYVLHVYKPLAGRET